MTMPEPIRTVPTNEALHARLVRVEEMLAPRPSVPGPDEENAIDALPDPLARSQRKIDHLRAQLAKSRRREKAESAERDSLRATLEAIKRDIETHGKETRP